MLLNKWKTNITFKVFALKGLINSIHNFLKTQSTRTQTPKLFKNQ